MCQTCSFANDPHHRPTRLLPASLVLIAVLLPVSTLVARASAQGLRVADSGGVTTVQSQGRLLLEYRSQPNPNKVYVSRWLTPSGVQVLRDSPHDHVHHHALMYAIGIDGVDFWAEVPPEKFGRQVPVGPVATSAETLGGRQTVVIRQSIQWIAPGAKTLGEESRVLTVHPAADGGPSLLTWQFTLAPAAGHATAQIWGRHYFGLGMRFVESMDQHGTFMTEGNRPGESVRGTEKLTHANWCAYCAKADGKPVTVAMFDDPQNPRHPATWFTMTSPFAYLAATLDLEKTPLTITSDRPLTARYGLALWDGTLTAGQVDQTYRTWLSLK